MKDLWTYEQKKLRVRATPGIYKTIPFPEIGRVPEFTNGASVQAQLYFGVTVGTRGITIRFGRDYDDGRPTNWTGFQDFPTIEGKRTLNISPVWLGDLAPNMTFIVQFFARGGSGVVLGNHIYKGYE
jgi:hypothetical protein